MALSADINFRGLTVQGAYLKVSEVKANALGVYIQVTSYADLENRNKEISLDTQTYYYDWDALPGSTFEDYVNLAYQRLKKNEFQEAIDI